MTVATTANTKAKTEKHSDSSFGLPNSELPKIDLLKMEAPAAFRELADKGVAQARNTYENAKAESSPIKAWTKVLQAAANGLPFEIRKWESGAPVNSPPQVAQPSP